MAQKQRHADFLFIQGEPLADVSLLLQKDAIAAVFQGGRQMSTERKAYDPWQVTNLNSLKWTELYTRERVTAAARVVGKPSLRA